VIHTPTAIAAQAVTQAVVEAEFATLPEFDLVRMDTVTSPVYRTWRIAQRILFLNLL
jgi:hypothetical protein